MPKGVYIRTMKQETNNKYKEYVEMQNKLKWYEKRYPYIEKRRGKGNWKNLFRKPTLYEWIILVMLFMALLLWWAYNHDMEGCRQIVEECNAYLNPNYSSTLNYSNGTWWINKFEGNYFVNTSGGNNDSLE